MHTTDIAANWYAVDCDPASPISVPPCVLHRASKALAMDRRLLSFWNTEYVGQNVCAGDPLKPVPAIVNNGDRPARIAIPNSGGLGHVRQNVFPRVSDTTLLLSLLHIALNVKAGDWQAAGA